MPRKLEDQPTPDYQFKPAALDKSAAAYYTSLSVSTIETGVREKWFPPPRQISPGRAGWLVTELDEYLQSRPVSKLLPPPNTGARKGREFGKTAANDPTRTGALGSA